MAKATPKLIDFSDVKDSSGFNVSRIPSGDYAAIITKVENAEAKDGIAQYLFSIKLRSRSSSVFPYYCKLQENQLWKLRNIFIAAGKVVPKKKVKVDPNQIVGKLIGVTVEDDEYEGKPKSKIEAVFPAAELGDDSAVGTNDDDDADDSDDDEGVTFTPDADDDEDEAEEVSDDEDEDEAEEEAEEADPYADLDRSELKKRIKAAQNDFKILTKHTDNDLRGFLAKIEAEADEDEAEEEPATKAAPKKRTPKPKAEELSDDDLDDINIDDL